jgi:tRNA(Arg) A34 adenosine deaminase TadA
MMTAFALVTHRFVHESSNDANIGAILVSPTGTITAWALNTKEFNSTFHAEVNLMQSVFFNNSSVLSKLDGFRIYTTLKPCRMCAAMIHHVGDGAISVIYGQEDNSEDATGTDLDKGSKQWLLKESINVGTESKHISMQEKLHEHRNATKGEGKMWQSLAQDNARNLMLMASTGSLQRELNYLKSIRTEFDVLVYKHIKAFLKARNVAPKQIADAIAELYG